MACDAGVTVEGVCKRVCPQPGAWFVPRTLGPEICRMKS